MKNPFDFLNTIKDPELFFGRKEILYKLYRMLNSSGNCSVVGPRRVGKSSLLYHIALPDIYSSYLDEPETYVFAFIDLQVIAGLGVDDFLMMAIERLCRASRGRLKFSPEEYGNERGFQRFLEKACDENLKLVLCCDEFECLDPRNGFSCEHNFFTFLRGMLMGYNLTMVTSSQAHLPELCYEGHLPSPLWNIFIEFPLGLMTEEEMLSLIKEPFARSGINLTDDEIIFISDLAGSHPFFLQMACHYLFESKITQGSPNFPEIEKQFNDNATAHYDYAWGKLDDEQKEGLKSLVEDGAIPEGTVLDKLKGNAIVTGKNQISSTGWKRFVEQKLWSRRRPAKEDEAEKKLYAAVRRAVLEAMRGPKHGKVKFDVFLAYNSVDRDKVEAIGEALKQEGLIPWLDKEQIPPGRWFQKVIQQAIVTVKSAAIFIGQEGLGRWQSVELPSIISQCVERGIPVIPVLLPGVTRIPDDLLFLKELNWVCFKTVDDPEAIKKLYWGITGERLRK
ncbi:MAG: TIR domain-containing protein [Candidatus Thorarchaeota archaeon]